MSPLIVRWGWTRWLLKVPSNPKYSVFLWFYNFVYGRDWFCITLLVAHLSALHHHSAVKTLQDARCNYPVIPEFICVVSQTAREKANWADILNCSNYEASMGCLAHDIVCFIWWRIIQSGIKWERALFTTCRKASRFVEAWGQHASLNLLPISWLHKEAKDHKLAVFSLTKC